MEDRKVASFAVLFFFGPGNLGVIWPVHLPGRFKVGRRQVIVRNRLRKPVRKLALTFVPLTCLRELTFDLQY